MRFCECTSESLKEFNESHDTDSSVVAFLVISFLFR